MVLLKKILQFFYLSSLNVVLATGACSAAFMKLPDGSGKIHWISLMQIMLTCWIVYILDRVLDVIRAEKPLMTERHQFHFKNQYNLQVFAIALIALNIFLLFFQPKEILFFGGAVTGFVLIYLYIIVPKIPQAKDFLMPLIYTLAVVGVPYVQMSSISLSSWIVGFMFLLIVHQNLLAFSYFEDLTLHKRRKATNYIAALCLFLFVLLFTGGWEYPNKLALILTLISVTYSLIVSNEERFKNNFRWIMDGLLFLPLILVIF